MKVWFDREEVPIFTLTTDIPPWVLRDFPKRVVDMDEQQYLRLKKSLSIAEDNYWAVQGEILEIWEGTPGADH